MHAVLRRLHSPDVHDLERHIPDEPDSFSFLLQILVGPSDGPGEESFDVIVCTPRWLLENHSVDEIVMGKDRLIVFKYDYLHMKEFLTKVVNRIEGATWEDVVNRIGRLGRWEFEDYTPKQDINRH